jgi:hypothetical protein
LFTRAARPDFVVSQFHGKNIAMSWFLVVQPINGTLYKLVVWGTGKEVPSMLFDLHADPGESRNLVTEFATTGAETEVTEMDMGAGGTGGGGGAGARQHTVAAVAAVVAELEARLASVVDYPAVAQTVAEYINKEAFIWWTNSTKNWREVVAGESAAPVAWARDAAAAFDAVDRWMAEPARVLPCRGTVVSP